VTQGDAIRAVIEAADRDELVAFELVARAIEVSGERLMRDWRRRRLPEVRVGRAIRLPARIVRETHFSYLR